MTKKLSRQLDRILDGRPQKLHCKQNITHKIYKLEREVNRLKIRMMRLHKEDQNSGLTRNINNEITNNINITQLRMNDVDDNQFYKLIRSIQSGITLVDDTSCNQETIDGLNNSLLCDDNVQGVNLIKQSILKRKQLDLEI
jgi:hypothetical protein